MKIIHFPGRYVVDKNGSWHQVGLKKTVSIILSLRKLILKNCCHCLPIEAMFNNGGFIMYLKKVIIQNVLFLVSEIALCLGICEAKVALPYF